ncbi:MULTISPECIES: GAF domain-containing protein [unclassified Paenibacillus]|uniref:GAF domain-containing protein n=1 Tax=unclassified Paenibacillus TaxID=185978 RepID=UPI002404BB8E|nr:MULTISPECIES: GAF domain-containing protein [unclassified Paenibacillus]MDF9843339.1 L-methionine (R)-S-oxide reductase [Paenibacillus sp. PastF-2]MDF9849927.1 L-methionine (R)-S-oxide reductase [Paenibacillus sp. PastM-2]MDF9856635.1 L-methionine (R)-S-oxide reductase [Paenibacillus sp. PastF-1]MDH6481904.1 L-methionine (R)-S-oxide reductase [Paenibacillus sp. PastH-2]MDH6509330.1 L-methionine (R)-S-oxide reductase [Paenibacillus sp. PastM-3]
MFQAMPYDGTRSERFESVLSQLAALIDGEPSAIANLANASALLKFSMPDTNWTGFYLFDGKELVLGPFQGLPACIRIPLGRGVCGTSAAERRTLVVDDVHAFPGHIACDAASNSEIVVPLIKGDQLLGVLDIDSPLKHRFDDEERRFLERFAAMIAAVL